MFLKILKSCIALLLSFLAAQTMAQVYPPQPYTNPRYESAEERWQRQQWYHQQTDKYYQRQLEYIQRSNQQQQSHQREVLYGPNPNNIQNIFNPNK